MNCRIGYIADEIGGYIDATGNQLTSLKGLILRDVVWQVKDFIRVDGLLIPHGKFTRSWVRKQFIGGNEREKSLLATVLDNDMDRDFLDDYFRENPLDMYVLDDQQEIKKGVLRRTGMKDMSRLGRLTKSGLI